MSENKENPSLIQKLVESLHDTSILDGEFTGKEFSSDVSMVAPLVILMQETFASNGDKEALLEQMPPMLALIIRMNQAMSDKSEIEPVIRTFCIKHLIISAMYRGDDQLLRLYEDLEEAYCRIKQSLK